MLFGVPVVRPSRPSPSVPDEGPPWPRLARPAISCSMPWNEGDRTRLLQGSSHLSIEIGKRYAMADDVVDNVYFPTGGTLSPLATPELEQGRSRTVGIPSPSAIGWSPVGRDDRSAGGRVGYGGIPCAPRRAGRAPRLGRPERSSSTCGGCASSTRWACPPSWKRTWPGRTGSGRCRSSRGGTVRAAGLLGHRDGQAGDLDRPVSFCGAGVGSAASTIEGAEMETNMNPEPGDNEAPTPEQQRGCQQGEETPQPTSPESDDEVTPEAQSIGE